MSRPAYQRHPPDPSSDIGAPPPRILPPTVNLPQAICQSYGRTLKAKNPPQLAKIGDGVVYEFGPEAGTRDLPPPPTTGRGFLYDFGPQGGPVVYSPNCHRPDLRLPEHEGVSLSGSVLQGRDYDLDAFKQPQYWSRSQGFFAFVPRYPMDTSTPSLSSLRRLPPINKPPNARYARPSGGRWLDWKDLQRKVVAASQTLLQYAGMPTAYPAAPCAHIECHRYDDEAKLEGDLERARDWFAVWFAILAYSIAVLEAMGAKVQELSLPRFVPEWMTVLRDAAKKDDRPLDEVFLSDVSYVASPSNRMISRVGTFVMIPDNLDPEMVSVDWLISLNIPVFWQWSERESLIAEKHPFFRRFRPPVDAYRVFDGGVAVGPAPTNPPPSATKLPSQRSSPPVPAEPFPSLDDPTSLSPVSPHAQPGTSDLPSPTPLPPQYPSRAQFLQRPDPTQSQLVAWDSVALTREERRKTQIAKETPSQSQLRIAKEANPPTRHNKVSFWVWERDDSGVYRAEKADKETAQEMFTVESGYSRQQALYDYFSNSWHVASFLGRPDDEQLEYLALCESEYHNTPFELEHKILRVWFKMDDVPNETPLQMKSRLVGTGSQEKENPRMPQGAAQVEPTGGDGEAREASFTDDPQAGVREAGEANFAGDPQTGARDACEASAYLLGGYVVPVDLDVDQLSPPDVVGRSIIGFLLGQRRMQAINPKSTYWESPQGKALGRFGEALGDKFLPEDLFVKGPSALPSNWDLSPRSRLPIQHTARFQMMVRIEATFVEEVTRWDNVEGVVSSRTPRATRVFMFKGISDHRWLLGTTSAAVALHICRLDASMSPTELAYDLLGRGFRICTFAPSPFLPQAAPDPPRNLKRHRPSGYVWTEGDWDSWRSALKVFLRSSRGRAALLRGGLVWRIAMEYVQIDDVISGPSDMARQGVGVVRRDLEGYLYVDDDLSRDEVDFICGVHYVYMQGTPKQERRLHDAALPSSSSTCTQEGEARHLIEGRPLSTHQQQLQRVSYLPPEDLWLNRHGLFNGWPEDADAMFLKNMKELRSGGYQPKSWAQWKKLLMPPASIYHIPDRLEEACELAIVDANRPTSPNSSFIPPP